jgi:hypothetical protein
MIAVLSPLVYGAAPVHHIIIALLVNQSSQSSQFSLCLTKYVFFDQKILGKLFSSANSTNFAKKKFGPKKETLHFWSTSTEFFF